jgi:hypothetical protein
MSIALSSADEAWSHVLNSLSLAYINRSKLTQEILALEGFSGTKTRHLYNSICSAPWAKYLEVGVWKGSTFVSALYNNTHCNATAIDNWSAFSGSFSNLTALHQSTLPRRICL